MLASNTTSNTGDEHKDDWIVKSAANGVEYYYNIKTKKSQWEKPDSLKNPEERLNSTGWQEHVRADGKIFYHNPKLNQSTWKMPPEIKALKEKQVKSQSFFNTKAEIRKQAALQGESSNIGANSKITVSLSTNMEFLDDDTGAEEIPHEEAVRIFMVEGLLREKVPPTLKWDQVHQILHEEERYKIIKSIATKRKIYKDWVNQTKQLEKNEMRAKIEKAKDNFRAMLAEKNILTADSKFHKVAHLFMNDYRWKALEEKDRENIFQDYLDYLFDMEKQERRQKKKTLTEEIKKAFSLDNRITSETSWSTINDLYRNDQRWTGLEDYDKLTIFLEHILELDRKEREDKRKLRKLKERKNREAFRELLNEQLAKGKLSYKTKWRHFISSIRDDSRLLNLLGQPGSTPRELFEDKQEFLKDQHKKVKEDLKNIMKENNVNISQDIELDEFKQIFKSSKEFTELLEISQRFYYNYFIEKSKSKGKEIQKKKRKAQKKLLKFLKNSENVKKDSKFEDIQELLEQNLDFSNLILEEKRSIFLEWQSKSENNDEGQISEKDEDKTKKKKSKKKKNKKKRDDSIEKNDSSDHSDHESKSRSRSRSKSHNHKSKKKQKEESEKKMSPNTKDREKEVPFEAKNEPIKETGELKATKEQQDPSVNVSLIENQKIMSENDLIVNKQKEGKTQITENTNDPNQDPDQEEGEERNPMKIIKKKISKSSSKSNSISRSKKKKESKHSKKKSKKSDKKSKKKKKKRSSSRSQSSESEN